MAELTNFEKIDSSFSTIKESVGSINLGSNITIGSERRWGQGKTFCSVTLQEDGEGKHTRQFVAKSFKSKGEAVGEIDKCIKLENAGVPVPTTHRYFEKDGKHYILYTDLSSNGENTVWSLNNLKDAGVGFDLTSDEFYSVLEQVTNISKKAVGANILLRQDCYFLVREKDKVKVIIGDLGIGIDEYSKESSVALMMNSEYETKSFVDELRIFLPPDPPEN